MAFEIVKQGAHLLSQCFWSIFLEERPRQRRKTTSSNFPGEDKKKPEGPIAKSPSGVQVQTIQSGFSIAFAQPGAKTFSPPSSVEHHQADFLMNSRASLGFDQTVMITAIENEHGGINRCWNLLNSLPPAFW